MLEALMKSNTWRSVVLGGLFIGTLLGIASGGPRPLHRTPRHQHLQWEERIQHPSQHNAQRIEYPSLNHKDSQLVQYPSINGGQRCPAGYYQDRSGQFGHRCVPCSCNGLSTECEETTGRCLNCQYNSAGDQCERCKEGYYGNAAQKTCRVCPCPLGTDANNFAVGCSENGGRFQCLCKVGYTGERCERCAEGYYGDPQVYGGSCRPCNCPGGSCDSYTGECRNSLELRDKNTEDQCQECDNCAETLLNDLEMLEVDLSQIKDKLDLDSLASKEHLKKLEDAITATTNLVNSFNSEVNNQRPKINQLDQDVINLANDMDSLKEQVKMWSENSQKALANAENTHQRANDLSAETQNLLQKIKDLLKQIMDANSSGAILPSGDLAKFLEDAERMVKELKRRSFMPQKDAAKKEQDAAYAFLEHIKNITKQCDQNEEASKRVESLLKTYEAKLKELDDALKQADNMVKKAGGQNDLNAEGLKDILKHISDLERERALVRDQISIAVDQLKDTQDLLKMFNDSRKVYEKLAAELDGAKTDLDKKVKATSQAAAKESIVKQAEEHADNLHKLAVELQNAVQNMSERSGVQNTLSGIEAYKNITEAVNAAEEAAKKAKEAAVKALSDISEGDLMNRAKNLKDNGDNLLKQANNAAKDLKGATNDLSDQIKRLQDAEKKKKLLEDELRAVQDGLRGTQRDDIGNIINEAKKIAAAANRSTSDTMDQLNGIKATVNKISISPTDSNIDSVLNKVDMTVKNLNSSIPSLLDKIEELHSQIGPENNVSDNINKIKELIEQAREAANRIVVPMKFTGKGHVELRPPRDIDDLRAYTALTLSLQRPEKPLIRGDGTGRRRRQSQPGEDNLFVLYLGNKNASGDYIGMALQNNFLHVVYKLDGKEYDIEASNITESPSEPAFFDKIDIRRIYQDAEVVQTKQFTSSNPKPPQTAQNLGHLARNLLDLNPDDVVFYVGGYPDDFSPPASLNYGKYQGCIEVSTFNERFISLYNFKKAVNINLETPCKRYVPVDKWESEYFEGSGYAKYQLDKFPSRLLISQKIKTQSVDAILLYLGDEEDDFFYSINLERGYLVLRGREKNDILEPIKSEQKLSLSQETDVKLIFYSATQEFIIRAGDLELKKTGFIPQKFMHYYIGGVPKTLRERYNITVPALKGCVKIGTAGGITPTPKEKVGIGRSCSEELLAVRKAEFSVGGALETFHENFSLEGDVNLSLGFRSTNPDGLLLQHSQANNYIELTLEKGHVVLKSQDKIWKSSKQYQDGEWHYLTVIRQGQSIELRVDEDDVGKRLTESSSRLYSRNIVLGKDTFTGCISNVYLRRPDSLYKAEDLSVYTSTGDVLLNTCGAEYYI